jgi:hypothetical protein
LFSIRSPPQPGAAIPQRGQKKTWIKTLDPGSPYFAAGIAVSALFAEKTEHSPRQVF